MCDCILSLHVRFKVCDQIRYPAHWIRRGGALHQNIISLSHNM